MRVAGSVGEAGPDLAVADDAWRQCHAQVEQVAREPALQHVRGIGESDAVGVGGVRAPPSSSPQSAPIGAVQVHLDLDQGLEPVRRPRGSRPACPPCRRQARRRGRTGSGTGQVLHQVVAECGVPATTHRQAPARRGARRTAASRPPRTRGGDANMPASGPDTDHAITSCCWFLRAASPPAASSALVMTIWQPRREVRVRPRARSSMSSSSSHFSSSLPYQAGSTMTWQGRAGHGALARALDVDAVAEGDIQHGVADGPPRPRGACRRGR